MDRALRETLDRQEITDLIHDYCTYVDQYETEKVAALFTEDCITDYGPAFGGAIAGRRRVERGTGYTLATWRSTHHQVSNIRIRFENEDTATSLTYLHATHWVDDEAPVFHLYGRYLDRFVRTDEGWRFSERRLTVSGQENGENDFPGIGRRTPDPALVEKVRSRSR